MALCFWEGGNSICACDTVTSHGFKYKIHMTLFNFTWPCRCLLATVDWDRRQRSGVLHCCPFLSVECQKVSRSDVAEMMERTECSGSTVESVDMAGWVNMVEKHVEEVLDMEELVEVMQRWWKEVPVEIADWTSWN